MTKIKLAALILITAVLCASAIAANIYAADKYHKHLHNKMEQAQCQN